MRLPKQPPQIIYLDDKDSALMYLQLSEELQS